MLWEVRGVKLSLRQTRRGLGKGPQELRLLGLRAGRESARWGSGGFSVWLAGGGLVFKIKMGYLRSKKNYRFA